MDQKLLNRTESLLNYLRETVKLGRKTVRKLEQHDDLLLFQQELPEAQGVEQFSGSGQEQSFLIVRRQLIPEPPSLPDNLKGWVEESNDPEKSPQKIEERTIEDREETQTVIFDDDDSRIEVFDRYLDDWMNWAEETRPKKKVQDLFKKLFRANERLKYDETLELIWGHGILVWKNGDQTIKYPLITQRMMIDHKADEGIIRILALDDAEPQLEFDALADSNTSDLSDVCRGFETGIYELKDQESEQYLGINISRLLREITGRLSADAQVVSSLEDVDLTPNNIPRVIDCWVLFVRKLLQNAIIRDLESLHGKLKTEKVELPGGLQIFLRDLGETTSGWVEREPRDEWGAMLDKQVLFPRLFNQEQLQILDAIDRSDGVVVWGPPGTGKSHTIANLICQFMAEGKRVLVTSQKDQALSVLRDMIPERLRPLCISLLRNMPNSREQLEEAVTTITEIATQSQPNSIRKEISRLEESIDQNREKLMRIKRKIENLAGEQLCPIIQDDGEVLLPGELAYKIKNDAEKHSWLIDSPPYEVERTIRNGKDAVRLLVKPPLSDKEIEELKELRVSLHEHFEDFSRELPALAELINVDQFINMMEDLRKSERIEEEQVGYVNGLIFKDKSEETVNQALRAIEEGLDVYQLITDPWQFSILMKIRGNSPEIEAVKEAKNKLSPIAEWISGFYRDKDLLKTVKLNHAPPLNEQREWISEAMLRVKKNRKPWKRFDGNEKKQFLKSIRVNNSYPVSVDDWESVAHYVELMIALHDFRSSWNALAENIGAPEILEVNSTEAVSKVVALIRALQAPFQYEEVHRPRMLKVLRDTIVDADTFLSDELLGILYKVLSLEKEQQRFRSSINLRERLRRYLSKLAEHDSPHPVVHELLSCINEGVRSDVDQRWNVAYRKVLMLEELRPSYDRFKDLVKQLGKQAPDWAQKWLNGEEYLERELCPSYWQESWRYNALRKYIDDICGKTSKLSEMEKEQAKLESALQRHKESLVYEKTKLGLITTIDEVHLQALKRWQLAIRRLGRGKSRWAWKKERDVQREMKQAQNAVPVWIMNTYRVSETIPSEFGSFDVVIVDEASQCNVLAYPAVMRGKKIIIVGDKEQVSPDSVGVPQERMERLIKQFLVDIPNSNYYDLRVSIYDLANIAFSRQGTLMLREHFRCVPEIIQFSNNLCYQGKILPLKNPPLSERLEPPLQSVFIRGGYREERQDVNKPEARALCEKLRELVSDPRYHGKTFGAISLTGVDQARYIFSIVDEYLTPEQQEAIEFRVGDAYSFQGDERDVIMLSMVVGSNDERRFVPLTGDVYRQRFNVAASRAKDQLFLFHSVELGKDLKRPDDMRYKLLDYIQNGSWRDSVRMREKEKFKGLFQSPFEEAVHDWLTEHGYRVIPQVKAGVGEKRIDLVVEGTNSRLAVECDGDRWHPPEKWWEDRIRQRQLERVGWKFWRVWGSAFYKDPDSAMASIIPTLDELGIRPRSC